MASQTLNSSSEHNNPFKSPPNLSKTLFLSLFLSHVPSPVSNHRRRFNSPAHLISHFQQQHPEMDRKQRNRSWPALQTAARILRRASGRRLMPVSSVRVRETAAAQIEERPSDWAYSRPIVVLDLVWNAFFVLAADVVLVLSGDQTTSVLLLRDMDTGLRVWRLRVCSIALGSGY